MPGERGLPGFGIKGDQGQKGDVGPPGPGSQVDGKRIFLLVKCIKAVFTQVCD